MQRRPPGLSSYLRWKMSMSGGWRDGWMQIFTWQSRNSSHRVCYTMNICAAKCLCMWPLWGRMNGIRQSAVTGGSSHPQGASMRRLLPRKVLTPALLEKKSRTCTMRFISSRDYLVGVIVKRPRKSESKKRSWPPLKNTCSPMSGRGKGGIPWALQDLTHKRSTRPEPTPFINT